MTRATTPGRSAVPFLAPTVRRVLAAEAGAVATVTALLAAQVRPLWALVAAAVVTVVPFVAVRRAPLVERVRALYRFVTDRAPELGVTTEYTDPSGRPVGVHWQRDTVTCVLEIVPSPHAVTVLGRATETQSALPLDALASCLRQHDIDVRSIDVVALGFRSSAGTVAADVYEELIGPLPAVAVRTVWAAVTLDLSANARAIEARGAGRPGAARTVVLATTRVQRALEVHGLGSRLSTATELRSAVSRLCRGVGPEHLTQTWSTAPLPGASSTGYGIDCAAITSEDIATLWATPSQGTTMAFHVQPARETRKVHVRGTCRFVTRSPMTRPQVKALTSMNGSQRDGMFAQLPLAVRGLHFVSPSSALETATANDSMLPVSGCGQLLGSDAQGNGVAMRLYGAGVDRVRIVGELYLAHQLLFRAIATGATVLVRTDRPHAWRGLTNAIGDPDRLLISSAPSRAPSSHDVVLLDFATGSTPPEQRHSAGPTVMTLSEHEPRGEPEDGRPRSNSDLSIVQPHASGARIRVRSGPVDIELTLVTIARETAFIGRPRSLRTAART